jgi:hypothetical protein
MIDHSLPKTRPAPSNGHVQILSAGNPQVPTKGFADAIAKEIAKGGTPHVVAGCYAISPARFSEWLRLGHVAAEAGDFEDPYGYLYRAVYATVCEARLQAEQKVYQGNPSGWLSYTLGREAIAAGAQRNYHHADAVEGGNDEAHNSDEE